MLVAGRPTEYVEDDQERYAQSVRNIRRERRRDVDREIGRVLGQTARGKLYEIQDRRRGKSNIISIIYLFFMYVRLTNVWPIILFLADFRAVVENSQVRITRSITSRFRRVVGVRPRTVDTQSHSEWLAF